jgi:hypothetical protein
MDGRKVRAKVQKLYLIERKPPADKYIRGFAIMGSTGNLYDVTITYTPKCTCPDYVTRHKRCKHIYFILMRIMGIEKGKEDEPEFTKYKLTRMFSKNIIINNDVIANDNIQAKYNKIKNSDGSKIELKPLDDLCPVCLDDLNNGDPVEYCKFSCGKPIHIDCFAMWTKVKPKNCLTCNAHWDKPKDTGYINLN